MVQTDAIGDSRRFAELYGELRRRAARLMRREDGFQTLQPTALVHEVWAQIAVRRPELCNRPDEFLAYAATAMRSILVSRARRRRRHQDIDGLTIGLADPVAGSIAERATDVLTLDAALTELATFDATMARVVELRFFGGLEFPAIAELLGIALRTLEREWPATRAWLGRRLA